MPAKLQDSNSSLSVKTMPLDSRLRFYIGARRLSRRLRVGNFHINYPEWDTGAPFDGFKQSGNGREYAQFGLDDFLEIKGVVGYGS